MGVYRSTDRENIWAPITAQVGLRQYPNGEFQKMVQVDSHLFAGTEGGVFLSTNNGTTGLQ